MVMEAMREFTKDRYGVDVMKVEVPIAMPFVEGTKSFKGTKAYTKQEAKDLFQKAPRRSRPSRSSIFPPA